MADRGHSVQRWLDAAEHARAQARRASEHAARASTQPIAARLEDEAHVHLESADCFEQAAISTFELGEIELRTTRLALRSTA